MVSSDLRDHLLPVLDRLLDEPQDLQQALFQFRNQRLAALRARRAEGFPDASMTRG